MPYEPEASLVSDPASSREFLSARIVYVILAGLLLLAAVTPDPRTWGIHHLAFLPWPVRIAAAVLLALLAIPSVAQRLGALVTRLGSLAFRSIAFPILIALMAGLAFTTWRLGMQFLGDGPVWQAKLGGGKAFYHYEPLSTAIIGAMARWIDPEHPQLAARWPSIGFGVLYVISTWFVCKLLWKSAASRGLGWCLLLIHPTLLLFFGYIDSNPLLVLVQCLTVASIALAARRRRFLLLLVVVIGFGIAVHLSAISWLPAVAILPWVTSDGRSRLTLNAIFWRRVAVGAGLVGATLAVAAMLVAAAGASPPGLFEVLLNDRAFGKAPAGWLFSFDHLVEFVNQYALLFFPCLVLVGSITSLRSAAQRSAAQRTTWLPIAGLLLGPVLMSIFVRPLLGGARDWDLYTGLTIPFLLLLIHVWELDTAEDQISREKQHRSEAMVGWTLGLSIVLTTSWLAVNLDPARGAARIEVIQRPNGPLDDFARGNANELLGAYFRVIDPAASRKAWLRATEAVPSNPRYYRGLLDAEMRLGNLRGARKAWLRLAQLLPDDPEVKRLLEYLGP